MSEWAPEWYLSEISHAMSETWMDMGMSEAKIDRFKFCSIRVHASRLRYVHEPYEKANPT